MEHSNIAMAPFFSDLFLRSKINGIIQMTAGGDITAVNAAFTALFGYETEDMAGRHFSMLFTEEDKREGKPKKELESVLRSGQADDKNFMVHKNGQISWVSGESILIDQMDGSKSILKIIQDIHQQKDAEISFHQISGFNESILQAIDDIVVLLDYELQILKFNPAFVRLFSNNEFSSSADFASIIRPYDRDQKLIGQIVDVSETGRGFTRQLFSFLTPDGDRVFEMSCQPIFRKDMPTVVLLVAHDVSAQKKTETDREDIMGFVVHELRNPLASIRLSNDLITAKIKDTSSKELVQMLEKNKSHIDRLNQMIAELYDAAKVGGGQFNLHLATFNFSECVQESVNVAVSLYPFSNITVTGDAGVVVRADRYRIGQVISNYLSNAIKYSQPPHKITVDFAVFDNRIRLSVEDEGEGISQSQLPFVFDRYFRATKTRSMEGIGLGLFLCKRIIHAHGGEVWATSEDGKGSVFYFTLPIE